MADKPTEQQGIDKWDLLCLLFVAFKITGHVNLSWWVILSPFYIIPLLEICMLLFGLAGAIVSALKKEKK